MIKKLLASIRATNDATSSAEAWRLVEMARSEHTATVSMLGRAEAAYRASLTADDLKASQDADDEVMRCKVLLDRAVAAIELAEERHAEAVAREAETERRRRYAEAQTARQTALKALDEYPAHALAIRAILKRVAEANVAVQAANADLPAGLAALLPPETELRGLPSKPEVILKRERQPDAWFFAGRHESFGRVDDFRLDEIVKTGPRTGTLVYRLRGGVEDCEVELRPTDNRVTFLPYQSAYRPDPLSIRIALPGLRPGEPDIWEPAGNPAIVNDMGTDGAAVLAVVEECEAAQGHAEDPRLAPTQDWRLEPIPRTAPLAEEVAA